MCFSVLRAKSSASARKHIIRALNVTQGKRWVAEQKIVHVVEEYLIFFCSEPVKYNKTWGLFPLRNSINVFHGSQCEDSRSKTVCRTGTITTVSFTPVLTLQLAETRLDFPMNPIPSSRLIYLQQTAIYVHLLAARPEGVKRDLSSDEAI